ncbi:MAG TPA: sugar phosphate isomerase/epimerase family protein [Chthoniobacteraceae bacterium]|nr:sugar phosphate isomerase/epimerase family protein [Chthoniobacteraceae bacterium]
MKSLLLSGIADEAARSLPRQIEAHRELGWSAIELRLIDGRNICGEPAGDAFEKAAALLEASGLRVTAFASAIGNWSRPITGDFAIDLAELRRAAPRMRRLGAPFLRTMSWLRGDATETEWRSQCLKRYRELARIAEGEGIRLAHENCAGWAGQSGCHMVELLEETASPALGLLFDIGNTISHGHEPWPFYEAVKPHICHVHIKDCAWADDRGRSQRYRYPGRGDAQVARFLADLLASGYDGAIAIEPHVAAIIHEGGAADEEAMYTSYLRYARELETLIATCRL